MASENSTVIYNLHGMLIVFSRIDFNPMRSRCFVCDKAFLVIHGLISVALPYVLIAFDVLLNSVREKLRALLSNITRAYCSGS